MPAEWGGQVDQTVTVGTQPAFDADNRPVASLFYTYYERTDVPDLKAFVVAVRQSTRHGLPIARVLKIQSQELREKRPADALAPGVACYCEQADPSAADDRDSANPAAVLENPHDRLAVDTAGIEFPELRVRGAIADIGPPGEADAVQRGIDQYRFPRTVFMPGDISAEQRAFYVELMRKVTQTDEFKAYVKQNALVPTFLQGEQLTAYIEQDTARVTPVFKEAGWLQK